MSRFIETSNPTQTCLHKCLRRGRISQGFIFMPSEHSQLISGLFIVEVGQTETAGLLIVQPFSCSKCYCITDSLQPGRLYSKPDYTTWVCIYYDNGMHLRSQTKIKLAYVVLLSEFHRFQ